MWWKKLRYIPCLNAGSKILREKHPEPEKLSVFWMGKYYLNEHRHPFCVKCVRHVVELLTWCWCQRMIFFSFHNFHMLTSAASLFLWNHVCRLFNALKYVSFVFSSCCWKHGRWCMMVASCRIWSAHKVKEWSPVHGGAQRLGLGVYQSQVYWSFTDFHLLSSLQTSR